MKATATPIWTRGPVIAPPHRPQNFASAAIDAPHLGQVALWNGCPQLVQNLALGTFSALQCGHGTVPGLKFVPHSCGRISRQPWTTFRIVGR